MTTATIGTVSHGTMRAEDLIGAFLDELTSLAPEKAQAIADEYGIGSGAEYGTEEFFDSEEAGWMVEALFDTLGELAPAFCYFGATEGDGSDYGFWPIDIRDIKADEEVTTVNDLSQVKDDTTGYVLLVNDHGNCTLYATERAEDRPMGGVAGQVYLRELWAIV